MLLIMAAAAKKMVAVDDSSSSDDEALKRCQEAVWDIRSDKNKDEDSNVHQSKRVVVADHDHDGNELQVTKGFQIHVAKKLGHLLDSSITEMETETLACVKSAKCGGDDDEGFRLFSTSVPGQTADDTPAPMRRRPVPSSSDSDSEMETRLREAAVSVKDLLHTSSLPSTLSTPSAELPCSEKVKKTTKVAEGEENHVKKKKKKKKKRKPNQESEQVDSAGSPLNAQRNGDLRTSEQELTQVKVKRKKKRERELHTEED
ncbi:protein CUSTOS isoform X1 [Sander vitreus]